MIDPQHVSSAEYMALFRDRRCIGIDMSPMTVDERSRNHEHILKRGEGAAIAGGLLFAGSFIIEDALPGPIESYTWVEPTH